MAADIEVTGCHDCPFVMDVQHEYFCNMADTKVPGHEVDNYMLALIHNQKHERPKLCPLDTAPITIRAKARP